MFPLAQTYCWAFWRRGYVFCEGLLFMRAERPLPADCNVKRQLVFTHQWTLCPKMDTGGLFQETKNQGRGKST